MHKKKLYSGGSYLIGYSEVPIIRSFWLHVIGRRSLGKRFPNLSQLPRGYIMWISNSHM